MGTNQKKTIMTQCIYTSDTSPYDMILGQDFVCQTVGYKIKVKTKANIYIQTQLHDDTSSWRK